MGSYWENPEYTAQARGGLISPITRRTAPHIGHKNHLCEMAEGGNVSLEQMKDLVRNPKFMCKVCGRVAANSDNLCDPVTLE
jgi:hypothetical protein